MHLIFKTTTFKRVRFEARGRKVWNDTKLLNWLDFSIILTKPCEFLLLSWL